MHLWMIFVVGICLSASCGDSSAPGAQPGEACQIVDEFDPKAGCPREASFCYAVGINSSCAEGALCIGEAGGMACTYSCTQDSDCVSTDPSAVCMKDCVTKLLRGFCVRPKVRARFTGDRCTNPDDGPDNDIGMSGYSI